jgi:hypothetical protein
MDPKNINIYNSFIRFKLIMLLTKLKVTKARAI